MDARSDDDWVGRTVGGRYHVARRLGQGGMGAVYEATQVDLSRRVALKVLHAHLTQNPELLTRFRREAQAAASLGHPNIIQVTDFGVDERGAAFLVMDYLEGASLGAVMAAQGQLPAGRVAFIGVQVFAALAAAHARGIVHRDLKPENVFLTSMPGVRDLVKLLDFGVAKLLDVEDSARITATGAVLGTPAYMAPEQARGREVDARTDVYAAGVLLYEALTGRPAFAAANYHAMLFAILEETPPPLAALRRDLDPALVAVVERAMARRPEERFQSATEALAALEPFAQTQSAASSATTPAGDAHPTGADTRRSLEVAATAHATPAATPAATSALRPPDAPTLLRTGSPTEGSVAVQGVPAGSRSRAVLIATGALALAAFVGGGAALWQLGRRAQPRTPHALATAAASTATDAARTDALEAAALAPADVAPASHTTHSPPSAPAAPDAESAPGTTTATTAATPTSASASAATSAATSASAPATARDPRNANDAHGPRAVTPAPRRAFALHASSFNARAAYPLPALRALAESATPDVTRCAARLDAASWAALREERGFDVYFRVDEGGAPNPLRVVFYHGTAVPPDFARCVHAALARSPLGPPRRAPDGDMMMGFNFEPQ